MKAKEILKLGYQFKYYSTEILKSKKILHVFYKKAYGITKVEKRFKKQIFIKMIQAYEKKQVTRWILKTFCVLIIPMIFEITIGIDLKVYVCTRGFMEVKKDLELMSE